MDTIGPSELLPGKPWYASKGIWAGAIGILVVIWNALPTFFPSLVLPAIPEWLLGLLASLGLYSRATATQRIR